MKVELIDWEHITSKHSSFWLQQLYPATIRACRDFRSFNNILGSCREPIPIFNEESFLSRIINSTISDYCKKNFNEEYGHN